MKDPVLEARLFILGLTIGGLLLVLASCTPTEVIKYKCPPLSPAPSSTIDALETVARKDPSSAAWVIDLDKHYQKCDIINSGGSE